MYELIRTLVINEVLGVPDIWKDINEVALVGGIMINHESGGKVGGPIIARTQVASG